MVRDTERATRRPGGIGGLRSGNDALRGFLGGQRATKMATRNLTHDRRITWSAWLPALVLIQLSALDTLTTLVGIRLGGHETWGPSIAAIARWGLPGLVLVKAAGDAVSLATLRLMPHRFLRVGWTLALFLAAVPVGANVVTLAR